MNGLNTKSMQQGELSSVEVKKGEKLRLRFGVLLHSAALEKDVDRAPIQVDGLLRRLSAGGRRNGLPA